MERQFHLADLFEIVAEAIPDRLALCDDRGQRSYGEMNRRASALAAGLYGLGIRRGDKVGLYLMNGPEYLESFFALIKIGAVPFNVNYRYRLEELVYLFGNADAKGVIHNEEYSDIVDGLMAALPELTVNVMVQERKDASSIAAGHSYEALIQADPSGAICERHEDDYILQYTGGTTGMPKGVMWPHKAFFFACLGGGGIYLGLPPISNPLEQADIVKNAPPIRSLPVAPLMHGAAIWAALSAILGGVTMVLDPMRSGFNAENIWDRVERQHVNMLVIVGDAMAVPLLDALKAFPGRWDLSKLFHIGSGGAIFSGHIKDSLKAILPHVNMGDGMGTSETGISGMGAPPTDGGFMRLPIDPNQDVISDGRIVEVGEEGFLSRTGHTPIGYYGDPDKTAEIFREIDGKVWVLTGDRARKDADGMMTVFGRGSTCINSGGEKVYPEEVEEVLRAHPSIQDAAVIGISDPKWGHRVSAVISIVAGQAAPDLNNIKAFCSTHLAGYKIPKSLLVTDDFHRSPAGKQDYNWAKGLFISI